MRPRAFVLWRPGTNCHFEMAHAFELAGARSTVVLLEELLSRKRKLSEGDLLGFPGGFADGDHFGAGRVAAIDLIYRLSDQVLEAREKHIPMIGVCNGFQMLVSAGLLPGDGQFGEPTAALDLNLQVRFEHWRRTALVIRDEGRCLWTAGISGESVHWPVAHGEGRLVTLDGAALIVVATYGTREGVATYPESPNGSPIAGITNADGTIVGFMPHPERSVDSRRSDGSGLLVFRSAVQAVS